MGIGAVIFLILLGLILIWLELLVIPGTTIAGIGGILLVGAGVYIAFDAIGTSAGLWTLGSALVLLVVSIVFFLKSNTWKKLSLNDSVQSTVEHYKENSIKPGDTATAISRLGPSGTVRVNDINVEAESLDGLIDPGTKLKITEVRKNKVFVKILKK
ncbi:MAG: NfeD family protein [Bacteroidales bacterium]